VLNKCSSINFSGWVNYAFTTLPPCNPPVGFNVTNLTPGGATINWATWLSALSYDYLVDQNRNDPATTTGLTNTLLTSANIPGLTENTWYYVHIRSKCAANEQSVWSLDSFLTPIPCRPPTINITHMNTDHAVASWEPVPTALQYEYALTTSPTPPALGTKYTYTSMQASSLYDGKDYYLHVRSLCNSIGIEGVSDWATASFKTWPVNVNNVAGDDFKIGAFPNPVKNTVTIHVAGKMQGDANIIITDISGKVLRTAILTGSKIDIDMSALPAGLYMLKYIDGAHTETMKLSKQ
jgi:hypothetical protein